MTTIALDLEKALAAALDGIFSSPAVATEPEPEPTFKVVHTTEPTPRRRSRRAYGAFHHWEKVETVTIRENREKNGIEILFPRKPGEDIIGMLKANGWRFNFATGCWWKIYSPAAHDFACRIKEMAR